ncbi:MAG: CarD family transcriptional regulator, partial [Planctomycetota bacterium]
TRHAQGPWLVLVSSEDEAVNFRNDLALFGVAGTVFPARETAARAGGGTAAVDPETLRARLQVAAAIAGPPKQRPRLLISSVLSMLQPVPDPAAFEREVLNLKEGMRLDAEQLLKRLIGLGYTREPLAEAPGEVSLRGDILDFFPFAADTPIRLETFEDELESIRLFEPADQRSIEKLEVLDVSLATDAGGIQDGTGVQATSLLGKTTTVVAIEPLRIDDRAQGLRIQSASHARSLLALQKAVEERPHVELQSLPAPDVMFETRSVQALEVGMAEAVPALRELIEQGQDVTVFCQSEGERARFDTRLEETGTANLRLQTRVGALSKGFRLPRSNWVCVHHRELIGILGKRGVLKARSSHKTKVLQSFFELKLGDYVVHAVHGLSRFEGLKRMKRGDGEEEHLQLVFADEVSLYVPASRIDLVQRYIGSGGASPKLDKIGSHSFRRRKEKVQQALFDLAGDLLEVQAKRAVRKREPWAGDPELTRAMIAAFPYEDTPDQAKTDEEIAGNLESDLPMDRLLCGDVGFGKTEVAIRAAFKAAEYGRQVAILVPTTVLAEQHNQTFRQR